MNFADMKDQLFDISGASNVLRSDQRSHPRCVIEVIKTKKSGEYREYKQMIQKQFSRFSILDEKNIVEVNYEEARWENGLGNFVINLAHTSTRWNPPMVSGDKIVCYMWHSSAPSGAGIDQIGKFVRNPNNLAFVGIVDTVNTHISRDGTIVEVTGWTLIKELEKMGVMSLNVRGENIYINEDQEQVTRVFESRNGEWVDGEGVRVILNLDGTPLVVGYDEITIRDILNDFLRNIHDTFPNFREHFILNFITGFNLRVIDFGTYWDRNKSFGIDPDILNLTLSNGYFTASGTPLEIFERIKNLIRNISGKRSIEFFIEPEKVSDSNNWKGKITIRKSPKIDELESGINYRNPRESYRPRGVETDQLKHGQIINCIMGRNVRKIDLLDTIEPIKNSILVVGNINLPRESWKRSYIMNKLNRIRNLTYQQLDNTYDDIDISGGLGDQPREGEDNRQLVKNKINRDERYRHKIKENGIITGYERDEVKIFGFKSNDEFSDPNNPNEMENLLSYKDDVVVLKIMNISSIEKRKEGIGTENPITIFDENINTFDQALELAIDELAIMSKRAERGYAVILDERADRLHLHNSLIRLQDHRKKSIKEMGFQSVAGLDNPLDPRSKLGIFTTYNFYYHNKISRWFSHQGITTKVAFVQERRPGLEGLDDFKALVREYVYDIEKEKTLKLEIGTVTEKLFFSESSDDVRHREENGLFAVILDDLRFLNNESVLNRTVTSTRTVLARVADFGYMVNESRAGMYKRPAIGDKVVLFKVGDQRIIVGRVQNFYRDENDRLTSPLPPAVKREEELAMVVPVGGGKMHFGDVLYSHVDQLIRLNQNQTIREEYLKNTMNIAFGGTRLINLIGRKYELYNRWLHTFTYINQNNHLYNPQRRFLGENVNNYDDLSRDNYAPPHPLGTDQRQGFGAFPELIPLENCFWVQTQSGGRFFSGEIYEGNELDGISDIESRDSFTQLISKKLQFLAGEGWRHYSLNSGKKDWKSNLPVPGRRGLSDQYSTRNLTLNQNKNSLEVAFLEDNDPDNLILLRIDGEIKLYYKGDKEITINGNNIEIKQASNIYIKMDEDYIELNKGSKKIIIDDSGGNNKIELNHGNNTKLTVKQNEVNIT